MPTPVGPAPRDPNDPDFWDWGPPPDDEPGGRAPGSRRLGRIVLAVLLVLALVLVSLRLFLG